MAAEPARAAPDWHPHTWREAFTPEWASAASRVVWLLRAGLAALTIFAATVPDPQYTTRLLLVSSALAGLLASVPFQFIRTPRPNVLRASEAFVLAAVGAHVMGHAFGFYAHVPFYDKILHFIIPLVIVIVLYALSSATAWIWDWRRVTPLEVGIYCFTITLALGAVWEIFEFTTDQLAGTREQDNNTDTMVDLISDMVGAFIGSVAVALAIYRARSASTRTAGRQVARVTTAAAAATRSRPRVLRQDRPHD